MCSSERHKLVWFILPHTNGIWTKFGSIGFQILWSYDGNLDSIAFQKLKIRQFSQCIKNLCRIFTTIPLHTKMEEEEGDSWSNPPVKTLIALQVLFCLANWTLIFFLSSLWKSLSSDQSLSHTRLFETPWTAVHQASLSIINSWSLLKLMSITSVMPSNHFILCHLLFLLPSVFLSSRVFSNESVLRIRWPKYWSFSFCLSFQWIFRTDLFFFRIDWLYPLSVQGTL